MSNILIKSTEEIDEIIKLLAKDIPSYRKAYSDRTSWLMAFISELAYIKFSPIFKGLSKEHFMKQVLKLVGNKSIKALNTLIETVGYDANEEKKKLEENVRLLNLQLIKTFDNNGTQAILFENDTYIVLGFRGTEATSMKDIKSDVKAVIKTCKTGGEIHSGFDEAFSQVAVEIHQFLNQDKFKDKPLFITGHSLGGGASNRYRQKSKP
jgi:hypothetical protein